MRIRMLLNAALVAFCLVFVASAQAEPLDLNTATAEQLAQTLKGIGPGKAEAIVLYRSEHGRFNSIDELLQVKGIGSVTVEKNRSLLMVGESGAAGQ